MKSMDWLNVVGDTPPTFAAELGGADSECMRCKKPEKNHFGPSKFCDACVFPERSTLREGRLEESGDDNSTLRRQHHLRSAVSSTPSDSLRSQVGSLSQDLSSMPRTLLGDALTADGGAPGVAPADRVSEDVLLVEHDFNCNQAMRAVIKTLFVIQEKQLGPADGNMPPWMQEFFKTLTLKDTDFRVQLFLVKVLVNYHKNLRRMEAAGRHMQDMFQPFADRFNPCTTHARTHAHRQSGTHERTREARIHTIHIPHTIDFSKAFSTRTTGLHRGSAGQGSRTPGIVRTT
jgi:hypothetical protein